MPTLPSTLRRADISFDIMPSNDRFSFDVLKRSHKDMIMGKKQDSTIFTITLIYTTLHIYALVILRATFQLLIPISHLSGVVRQLQPITGPKDIILEVAMNYDNSGVVFHRNIVVIHIFISEFWF